MIPYRGYHETIRACDLLQRLIAVERQAILQFDIVGRGVINRNERLDVLLARLRKKARTTLNKSLPIKTRHMHGYAFIAAAITQ
ncbi:MAG: hypothetical protein Q7U18_05280 [Methylobacter sp.]|nr:hypothetical protein [Methylobacter sp.]